MTQASPVSSIDRLSFTVFVALVFHALLMLGLTFDREEKPAPPPTLEVTLATYQSKERPKEIDFLAQMNQEGSGTLDKKAMPASDQIAPFQDDRIKKVQPKTQTAAQLKPSNPKQAKITTQATAPHKATIDTNPKNNIPKAVEVDQPRRHINLQNEVASLEAHFREQRQEYAKRPKIKRLTAASTGQEAGAFYKEVWRQKVERVGNLNYPTAARRQHIYGELRMVVTIKRDGTLQNVEVLHSSGYRVLDDAAKRIVRLASPFAPFDDSLKGYDLVEIIRTWRFEEGDRLTGADG